MAEKKIEFYTRKEAEILNPLHLSPESISRKAEFKHLEEQFSKLLPSLHYFYKSQDAKFTTALSEIDRLEKQNCFLIEQLDSRKEKEKDNAKEALITIQDIRRLQRRDFKDALHLFDNNISTQKQKQMESLQAFQRLMKDSGHLPEDEWEKTIQSSSKNEEELEEEFLNQYTRLEGLCPIERYPIASSELELSSLQGSEINQSFLSESGYQETTEGSQNGKPGSREIKKLVDRSMEFNPGASISNHSLSEFT